MLHFGLMPLFMVEHSIIPLNSNHPKCNVPKEMPNLDCLDKFIRNSLPEEGLLPIDTIIVACLNPTKLMHNEGGPPPSSLGLDAIPNSCLTDSFCVGEAKATLL